MTTTNSMLIRTLTHNPEWLLEHGKYWIGDLCYVLKSKWGKIIEAIVIDNRVEDGFFKLPDGTEFVMFGTKYGDGNYSSSICVDFSVDSGTIGIVPFDQIKDLGLDFDWINMLGHTVDFEKKFWVKNQDDGTMRFGHVYIYTGSDSDYDKDDDNDDDDDYC
ncbi:MAG: hypothetical protein EOM23_02020 [Candidatus Moranbacteria bacterium]|nr:hypothetical protein [Candidatus Moranbacteria bacterium]